MKRFQRVNAFILALALFMSMIPAGVLELKTVAAEPDPDLGKTFLHAAYAATEVVVDGELDTIYRLDVPVGTLRIGAAWDLTNLYLAVNSDNTANVTIMVNGETVTGGVAAGNSCTEYKISLTVAKINDLTGSNTLTVQVGDATPVELQLVLSVNQYAQAVYMEPANGATPGGQTSAAGSITKGTAMILNANSASQGSLAKNQTAAEASTETTTVFEFDVSDLTLPNTSTVTNIGDNGWSIGRYFCSGGLSVTFRDDLDSGTSAFLLSLSNKNGSPVLTYFDNGSANGWVEAALTAADKYHVRVELSYTDDAAPIGTLDMNDTVSAKYFVNGECVAEGNSVRQSGGSKGTSLKNVAQFFTAKKTGLQVTVSDVSVTKIDPTAYNDLVKVKEVMDLIDGIGDTVTLSSKDTINAASEAYDALSSAVKPLVANVQKLEDAKAELNALENSYLLAMFSATEMTLDGKADEAIYTRAVWLSDTLRASLAWDTKNLYLAFTDTNTPNVSNLVINNKAVTVTGDNSKTTTGVRELRIPLNTVDITDLTKIYPISFQIGGLTWAGKVVFDTTAFETISIKDANNGAIKEQDDKVVVIKDLTARSTINAGANLDVWNASTAAATVLEFDLDINSLPETSTQDYSSRYVGTGLNVLVMDDLVTKGQDGNVNQAFKFGFFKQGGVIQLGHAADGEHRFVVVDDNDNGKFHVRVEYSYAEDAEKTVTAKYFVNDVLVATGENVRVNTVGLGTTGGKKVSLRVDSANMDAVLSNLSISKTNPTLVQDLTVRVEELERMIEAIGPVTMDRADYIGEVLDRFNQLSAVAQKLVKNVNVLQDAVTQLNQLENSYLHAVFVPVSVVVDGKADEPVFRRNLILGATEFGAAWDAKYLYLCFAGTTTPNVTELKINGKTVNTAGVTGTGVREIQVALKDLGITSLTVPYAISFKIGVQTWSGKLVLDNVDFGSVPHDNLYYAATGTQDKLSFTLDTWAVNDTGNQSNYMSLAYVRSEKLTSVTGAATVVEFDMSVDNMPDGYTVSSAPRRAFLNNGIAVSVRDERDTTDDNGFLFGLGKKNGQLYLIYWYYDTATQTNKFAEIPAGVSDRCYVRVEYVYGEGTAVTAKYYINGILILEQSNSYITGGAFGTTATNLIQFYAMVPQKSASATHKVVATFHNVSVGHTQPTLISDLSVEVPKVEALIDAIGLPITLDSKAKVDAALNAYNSLSDLAKTQVSNLNVLETAQARLRMLQNSYIHAAFSSEELLLDGKIFETAYRMNVKMTDTLKFGAVWSKKYLYLAFEDESAPAVTDLVINGKTVKLTSSNSKAGAVGREIRIALSSLGIVGYDKTYPISFRVGDIYWSGTLIQDSNDYEPLTHGSLYYAAAGSSDKKSLVLNTLTPDADGNKSRSLGMFTNEKLAAVSGKITILDLDVVINNMPDNCTVAKVPSRNFINNGVTFTYRDNLSPAADGSAAATEGMPFGLGKQNGKLMLYYWYNDANGNAQLGSADVPAASSYHLRVEYGNGNGKVTSAKYFINGILLAETTSSRVTASSFGTKAQNVLQIFAQASMETEAGRVDLRVSNVSGSHPQLLVIDDKSAAANMDNVIDAIGTVTLDSTEKIVAARELYDSLTSAQKKLVTKLAVLEAAEAKLRALKDQINAQYTAYAFAEYTTQDMNIDGVLEEKIWRTKQTIFGVGKLGMAWDFNYLYLTVTGSKVGTFKNLKINGMSVTDLGVAKGNVREMKILLSSVGIKAIDFTHGYDLSFSLDGKTWEGQLIFDTGTYAAMKPSSVSWGGSKDGYNGVLKSLDSTKDGKRVCVIYNSTKLDSINGMTTILEFDLKVNSMPNNGYDSGVNRNFLRGGVSVCIRDDDLNLGENGYGTEGFLLGLVRQKGNMYLVYWEDSTDEYVYVLVDDFGTNNYHLRIEYEYHTNDDVSAKYYVNGLFVAESHDAKEIAEDGAFLTNATDRIQVMAYGTDEGAVDAVISDLSISKNRFMDNPDPRDDITKDAIFGVLDLNHVQKDLTLPKEFVTVNGERFALSWKTSNSSVVTKEGKVTRPLEDPASATLTLVVDGEELWAVNVKVDPMSLEETESPENVDAAFSKAPIVIDGILDDEGWRMSGRVLDRNKQLYAEYGFQWTQSYLYVAVEYLDGINTLSLKLNGRYFTLKDGKLYRGGENVGGSGALAVTNGNVVEMRIPLSVLGLPSKISSYGYSIPMSLKAGPYVGNGKLLRLSNIDWVVTVNRNQETPGEVLKSVDAYHGAQRLANGYRLFDLYGGTNTAKNRSYFNITGTDALYENFSDRTYDTRVEFDFYAEALPVLPTDGSAYRPQGGLYSVSGLTFTGGEAQNADGYGDTFSYGIINTVNGLMFVLNIAGDIQTHLLNKQVGEKFSVAVEWRSDDSMDLFIDGDFVKTFYGAAAWKSGSANASLAGNMYVFFEPQSVADNYDVYVTNFAMGTVHHEENLLTQLDFEDIRGKNKLEDKITTDLVLPTSITNGQLDKEYKITWTSSHSAVNAATGKVTRPEIGASIVTLTATLSNGETKSFELVVYGSKAQNDGVLHVLEDLDPASGVGSSSKDIVFTFDDTNNSIIKVLDGETTINYVVLKDGDDKARLLPENLTLWVSDDNKVYTRVKDFKLLQVGEKWYLYDFEAECKYVKVHYTQPDGEDASFIGTYGEMIDAGYQKVFGATDDVTFTQSSYVLTNNTGKTQQDYAWTVSKKDLGITGTDASIRIYLDGKLQYHYVSGSDVVVRINDLEKGASVTLTVLSSTGKNVMDISNKEGVHEVIYGVRETTLSTTKYFYMTLPAGTTFPDGSRLEKETLYSLSGSGCRTSTDGGITWETYAVKNNAPEGKQPVKGYSQGGWIFDSVTGRITYEFYVSAKDVEVASDDKHYHISFACSDDGGKTWYLQYTMPCHLCTEGLIGDYNVPSYALTYADAIQLSSYDGKGPNVDFVFPVGHVWAYNDSYQCSAIYSTDGGDTWHYSKTPITYPSTYIGAEGGTSEGWIIERSDGVLVLHVRCQDKSAIHFKVSYSFDKGITWTNENLFSDYYATNGQATLKYMEVNGETTMISTWGGNSSLGGDSYHRNPFVFAASVNDGETFRNIQNITFRSFEEQYDEAYITETTNVSLAKYGNNLVFNYSRNRPGDKAKTVIEDFDDWFTRTKGGYDNFEHGTVRYEGWQKVYGTNNLASDIAQGKYSMQVGLDSRVIRSVPYLQDGKISVDIYVPAGSGFTFELQSGHTRTYNSLSVPIAFRAEGGKIYFGDSNVASAEGIQEGWNTLVFDLNMTKDKATLSINGGEAINIPLKMDFDDYVNFIAIGTDKVSTIYVDEVLIISNLQADVAVDAADKQAAAEVVELIKAIKTASNRDAAIKKARAAFDKLTQAQQDLIDARVLANNGKSGLAGMINYYEELRLYEDGDLVVENMIDEIGEVTFVSGEQIKAAEDAYKKLTSAQKAKVSNYGVLRVARLKYNRIIAHKTVSDQDAAEAVQEMIDALILSNPLRYEEKITAARKAYKALSADQLPLVDAKHLYQAEIKLASAKKVETARRLASIQHLINSLDNVTIEQIALIEGLRATVNELLAEDRAVLNDQKLVQAEQIIRSLKAGVDKKTVDEFRIAGVISYIDSIGQVTMEKKALIDAIRASYDKLTPKQQERVENIDTLVIAEATVLAQLQLTDAVPNTGDTTPGGITYEAAVFVMPVMLLSALAMAVLVIFPKKRKRR